VLINPLIPSRGRSGGGLARQHGHISGGFTTGHFHKGADGKIHFKAVNRYADKADWEKEIRKAAEGVGAKQESVKKAVSKAENASHAAQKLEEAGASKAAQAAAHKLASDAHLEAAKAFQMAGEGPAHKSGALTHNAHGAIHEAKSEELTKAAQAELEAAKAEAAKTEALAASKTALAGTGKPYSEQAADHLKAAKAHKGVAEVYKGAGNESAAGEHLDAASYHSDKAAYHQGKVQDSLKQYQKYADGAAASESKIPSEASAAMKATLHKSAAHDHEQAADYAKLAGKPELADKHTKLAERNLQNAGLNEQKAKAETAKAEAKGFTDKANELTAAAKDASTALPKEKAALHQQAAEAHKAAQAANEKVGNTYVAEAHGTAVAKHEKIAANQAELQKTLEGAAEKQSALAETASQNANGSVAKGESLDSQAIAHEGAAEAHGQAATAHSNLGNSEAADYHKGVQSAHQASAKGIKAKKAEQEAAQKAAEEHAAKLSKEADKASVHAGSLPASPEAVKAHQDAAQKHHAAKEAALKAGKTGLAQDHFENSDAHVQQAIKVQKQLDEQKAAEDDAKKAGKVANQASATAMGKGTTPEAVQAHKDAMKAHVEAKKAYQKAYLPEEAKLHHESAVAHLSQAGKIGNALKAAEAEKLAKQSELDKASLKAKKLSTEAKTANSITAHKVAADAHLDAQDAAKAAGDAKAEQYHNGMAITHTSKVKQLQKEQADLAEKQQVTKAVLRAEGLSAEANSAGETKEAVKKHLDAASAHYEAADKASLAGLHGDAEGFKGKAKEHAQKAEVIAQKLKNGGAKETALKAIADNAAAGNDPTPELVAQGKAAGLTPVEMINTHFDNVPGKKSTAAGDAATAAKAAEVPAPPVQTGGVKKPVGKLTGTGQQLGSHANEVMKDEAGNLWLKKTDDYSRVLDPALASLQRKVGVRTPVFVKTKDGHLQKMLPGAKEAFPDGNFNPEKLSEQDITKMLQHQVLDWATGNQDTHSGQWLRTKSGDLVQIDQAQAFKHGVGVGDPTHTYPPLGLDAPVYPKLWNAAKTGKIQIPDPNGDNEFAKTIKAIQDMPDDQFKALFKPYAMEVVKNGGNPGGHSTVEGFLDNITKHKNSIGKDFEKLYNQLPESAKSGAPALSKEAALKNVADHAAKGTLINSGAISKAKEAGASLAEIHEAAQKAKAAGPQLSPKEQALKALAEHEASGGSVAKGGELEKVAQQAGASVDEITHAAHHPQQYLESLKSKDTETSPTSGLTPKQEALKKFAEYNDNPPANWSLKTYKEMKQAAVDAGASQEELKTAQYDSEKFLKSLPKPSPAAPAGNSGTGKMTDKGKALKALADYQADTPPNHMDPFTIMQLEDAAKAAGASDIQITKIKNKPTEHADAYVAASKLTSKEDALKAIAENMESDDFNPAAYTALKEAATAHGATPEELKHVIQNPDQYLAGHSAPAAPAAPSAPVNPLHAAALQQAAKPQAKWTKTSHQHVYGGAPHDVEALAGPKGLHVHKGASGKGWVVTSADGKILGAGQKFATQKEAKLAAEWMAKNVGVSHIDEPNFKKWAQDHPDGVKTLQQGFIDKPWNTAAPSADVTSGAVSGKAVMPSTPVGLTGWKKVAHPVTGKDSYVHPESGIHITKSPYGTAWKLTTPDGTNIGVQYSLKDAKQAAAQLTKPFTPSYSVYHDEVKLKQVANAFGKDSQAYKDAEKAFESKHGSIPDVQEAAPPKPKEHLKFTGLSNDKVANAALLKKLYDQAHSPNATAADKIEYEKAQDAWKYKHSSGPFDPAKYIAPGQTPALGSYPNPQASTKKFPIQKGYEGWTPYNPAQGSSYGLATTDRSELAEITKHQWSQSTYDLGYRSASFNESLHGDWKPPYQDAGTGSGPYIYSEHHYTSINEQLRGNVKQGIAPLGTKGGKWDDVIAHMDKAFSDVPPLDRNIVVSRKMHGSGPFPATKMMPGEEYLDHGYNSTSKSRDVWSGDTHMEIRLPKGSKVLDLNHTYGSDNSSEQEVLLNRESKFRVIEDTTSTWKGQQVRHIIVELVP
jgi:hypothetical protein